MADEATNEPIPEPPAVLLGSGVRLDWRRLHPWGIARQLVNFAPGVFVVSALGRSGGGQSRFDTAEFIFGALLVVAAIARHNRQRYAITPEALVYRHGLVFRQEQLIERRLIQNVSKVTPWLYRRLGITTVTVTESSGRASISLGPVAITVADELMAVLDADRADRAAAPAADGAADGGGDGGGGPDVAADEGGGDGGVEVRVPWRRVALAQFTTANYVAVVLLPLGLVDRRFLIGVGAFLVLSLVISASTTFANSGFRLVVDGSRVRTSSGPLTEVAQAINTGQLQWVRVRRWLMHRRLGLEVVSFSTAEGSTGREDRLAPAWPLGTWTELARLVVTPLQATEDDLQPISARTVARVRVYGAVLVVVVGAGAIVWPALLVAAVVLAPVVIWWYPRQRGRRFGIGVVGDQVITRTGAIVERVHLTTLGRIEGAVVTQSPGQRRRGLASLRFTGVGLSSTVTVPDLAQDDARAWARLLVAGSDRWFRETPSGSGADPAAAAGAAGSEADPGVADPAALVDQPLPVGAVAVWRTWGALAAVGLTAVLALPSLAVAVTRFKDLPTVPVAVIAGAGVVAMAASWFLPPFYHRVWRWHADHARVAVEQGIVYRQRQIVLRRAIQSLRVSSDPIERRHELTSLVLHTAGESSSDLAIPHLAPDTVERLEKLYRPRRPGSGPGPGDPAPETRPPTEPPPHPGPAS